MESVSAAICNARGAGTVNAGFLVDASEAQWECAPDEIELVGRGDEDVFVYQFRTNEGHLLVTRRLGWPASAVERRSVTFTWRTRRAQKNTRGECSDWRRVELLTFRYCRDVLLRLDFLKQQIHFHPDGSVK